jgi:hypothetical protein
MDAQTTQLDLATFLQLLREIAHTEGWSASLDGSCIRLRLKGVDDIFSPLSAVFYIISGRVIDHRSFWMREITDASIMPWWEVLEISLADMACDCGNQYKRQLRQAMLEALGFTTMQEPKASILHRQKRLRH